MKIRKAKEEDFEQIKKLQYKYYKDNVNEIERKKEGFVSVIYSVEALRDISKEGIFVCEVDKKVVGLIMPLTTIQANKVSLLRPFVKKFSEYLYKGKKLSDYKLVIAGQILVDKPYKGKGVAENLWKKFVELMGKKYELIVSEISDQNPRSLHVATTKLGFEIVKEYSAESRNWYFIVHNLK